MTNSWQYITEYYREHISDLRAYIVSRIGNRDLAADLTQDVFLRLLSVNGPIFPETLHSLAMRIARNIVIDHLRHKRFMIDSDCDMATFASALPDQIAICSAADISKRLEQGIARLTADCRIIYGMNLFDGKKVSEISTELDISYKLAERRLGEARKSVRRYLRLMAV